LGETKHLQQSSCFPPRICLAQAREVFAGILEDRMSTIRQGAHQLNSSRNPRASAKAHNFQGRLRRIKSCPSARAVAPRGNSDKVPTRQDQHHVPQLFENK
jgi:hypothetical protein